MNVKRSKILWIDVLKGIGMLAVVAGHIFEGEISRNLFIFHMPLFFFISGYLFKPTKAYKDFIYKKVVHLIIPYFAFLIPLYIYSNDFTSNKSAFWSFVFPIIYGGGLLKGYVGVFWFVTCLFLTQQLLNYIINSFSEKNIFVIMLIMFILSFINMYIFPNVSFFWNANVVLAASPIFYAGYIYRVKGAKVNELLVYLLGLIVLLFSFFCPQNVYDMKNANYGIPFVTLISSLIFIFNLKFLSKKISLHHFSLIIFSEVGKSSMVIMYLHQIIQMQLESKLALVDFIRFLLSIMLSYCLYFVISKFQISRILLLGSYKDLLKLTGKL